MISESELIAVWPVVRQSKPTIIRANSRPPRSAARDRGWKVALCLPDPQIGFRRVDEKLVPMHDPEAMKVALKIQEAVQHESGLDVVVNLGDFLDLAPQGRFTQEPGFALTTQAAIDAGHLFLAEQRSISPDSKVVLLAGNHDCSDAVTRLVTKDGFKPYSEIQVGDLALTVDQWGNRVWAPVEAVHIYPFDGELNSIENGWSSMLVTDNHRIVGKKPSNGEWLEEGTPQIPNHGIKGLSIVRAANNASEDYDVSDDIIRLLAWAVTDSHRSKNYGRWTFYQRPEKSDRITSLLDRIGLVYRSAMRDRKITEICGKVLKNPCSLQGEFHLDAESSKEMDTLLPGLFGRFLPEWAFSLSRRQVEVFLEEYIYTDGTIPTNTTGTSKSSVLYVSDVGLREQLMLLLTTNGFGVFAAEYRPRRLNIVDRAVRRDDTFWEEIYKVPYAGDVWCVTVSTGKMFVERKGTVYLTGNSRLENNILANALQSFGLKKANSPLSLSVLSVPYLLRLEELGVEYVEGYPSGAYWLNDHIRCIHGYKTRSAGSTADAVTKNERVSTIFGHIHRIEVQHRTQRDRFGPYRMFGATPGCLCKINGDVPSYHSAIDRNGAAVVQYEDWQQGVLVVHYQEDSDKYALEMVQIQDGWALFRGQIYSV